MHKYWNPLHVTLRAVGGLPSFRAQVLYAAFERAFRTTRRDDFRIVEFSVGWTAIREHDDGARPTEEAQTVLLREAWWRKHGFIHPGEVPKLAA